MRPLVSVNGHALHAVHAAFELQAAICALPFDEEDHLLQAADASWIG